MRCGVWLQITRGIQAIAAATDPSITSLWQGRESSSREMQAKASNIHACDALASFGNVLGEVSVCSPTDLSTPRYVSHDSAISPQADAPRAPSYFAACQPNGHDINYCARAPVPLTRVDGDVDVTQKVRSADGDARRRIARQ